MGRNRPDGAGMIGVYAGQMRKAPAPDLPTVIGQPFGGGFYAGEIESGGAWYKLIISEKSADITGGGTSWKTSNTATSGTGSSTDGLANTSAMAAAGLSLHPAASHCTSYTGGGQEDWYLPALGELNTVYQNLGFNSVGCPAHFQTGGAQAFTGTYYWASTQFAANAGWVQHMGSGFQTNSFKNSTAQRVRPIRRIPFTP